MTSEQLYDGRYRPQGVIGDGGMARVYRAFDTRLERPVAIKILHEQYASAPDVVERFKLEGRVAAGLAHPNIVSVYDFGDEHGRPYMVMEYVSGENLRQVIAREAPMPLPRVIVIMRQLTAALDFAHAHGVIHRDIKPENILVTGKGVVKVGDFGIARALAGTPLTTKGTVFGTAAYASPEQVSGQAVTAESDLYSAGIVLYEMLTGQAPFTGDNPVSVAMAQVNTEPAPPSTHVPNLPRGVETVVLKAIAKKTPHRYHSGYDLITALAGVGKVTWQPAPTPQPGAGTGQMGPSKGVGGAVAHTAIAPQLPRTRAGRRSSRGALAALLGLLALVAVAAVLIYRGQSGGSAEPPAVRAKPTSVPAANATQPGPATATDIVGSSHGASITLVTASGVSAQYAPIGAASSFHLSVGSIYAVAEVHGKASGDAVKFTWQYPDGTGYVYVNDVVSPYAGTVTAYGQLVPRGLGKYTVTTAINGHVLASTAFTVTSG